MTEILQEAIETGKKIGELIARAEFRVGDAQKVLERWDNMIRSLEDIEKSRDAWRGLAKQLKKELRELKEK